MYRFSVSTSLCFLLVLNFNEVAAQKQNNTWYFGKGLGMTFNNGVGEALPAATHAITQYIYSSSVISDKHSGQVLFYTNAVNVYNRNHQVMPNGVINLASQNILIVPYPDDTLKYYIFYTVSYKMYYSIVDLSLDGGLGDVTIKNILFLSNVDSRFTAVKKLYDGGYWLITHALNDRMFNVYSISGDGINLNPIVSNTSEVSSQGWSDGAYYSEMISSTDGKTLAVLNNSFDFIGYRNVLLFDFDKRCGAVSHRKTIVSTYYLYDIAFDAQTKFLYLTENLNTLFQYDLTNTIVYDTLSSKDAIVKSTSPIERMKLGPDDKIYITKEEMLGNGLSPSRHLDVVHNPSIKGGGCNYQEWYINLSPLTQTYLTDRLPGMILDRTLQQPSGFEKPELTTEQFCLGDTTLFKLKNTNINADSVQWDFGDGHTKKTLNTFNKYADSGTYIIKFNWYLCGIPYYVKTNVKIGIKPEVNLGSDTTLCSGTMYTLNAGVADKYLWSTGDTIQVINVSTAGKYGVMVNSGQCSLQKDVTINYFPDIWTLLGDEYFICDKENELVKLDAGEGFQTYKWLPTGDTTQWINVAEIKDYFVIVKDFRGCEGNDGTKVKRRCPVKVFFPNAFTPNGDGINDYYLPIGTDVTEFQMTIFNRWGERIFETNSLSKAWDGMVNGKPASTDVYVYKATYKGYFNKQLKTFDAKGNITLIR